ncbi:MAG: hypothetical protein AB7T74_08145 [Clostridia bacterium]|nr:hypothetical protein [Spirochaetia bacterium]
MPCGLGWLGAFPEQVFAKLQVIAATCAATPDLDTRPADEVPGYNADGVFRSDN